MYWKDFCSLSGLVECLPWKTWDLSSDVEKQGGQNACYSTSALGLLGLKKEMSLPLYSREEKVSVETGAQEWPLAELPASIIHGPSPSSRLWNIMLGNLNFQSISQVSGLGLFPSTSRELLLTCIPPRTIFPGQVFPLSNTVCGKVIYSAPLHSFLCRYFLKRVKAPRAEVFIVTFPCLLPEAALVLSGQQLGLWCAPCTFSTEGEVPTGAQSLVQSPASCPVPCLMSSMWQPLPREEKVRPPLRWRRN